MKNHTYREATIQKEPRVTTVKRTRLLSLIFTVVLVSVLLRIFSLQVLGYQSYQEKVIRQITAGSVLRAPRGNIYDANGVLLATDVTVWRIFISPVDVASKSRKDGIDYGRIIADGLSEILSLDSDALYEKTLKTTHMDETIKRKVSNEEKDAVLRFAKEKQLTSMIHAEATTTRYYPYGDFASHLIGFTGSDNQGLFGLESYYDRLLTGEDGQYITARDATSKVLENGYAGYTEPTPGLSITTTIDAYIQRELEHELSEALINANAQNRVTGIAINVNTGAILAMATLPAYDLNNPYTLNEYSQSKLIASGYTEGSTEYKNYKSQLLYETWNNKPLSELYEPGSTFKILTCAIALECGVVRLDETFSCPGYYRVGGYNISCHKRGGHGTLTFAEGLQQSCNPVMMQVAERIGSERFYEYFERLGYLEKTGVDLPSEAKGIFHTKEGLGTTELATTSFGQRFKVTPIAHLAAICAVANGGYSVTPHLFDYATDVNGKVAESYQAPQKERIFSEETCKTLRTVLEGGVSGEGGAKNAYVAGYEIAAKTGTSEKFDILDTNGNSYLRIGSCVGFAPANDPEIAVIVIVDEPSCQNKYGSMTAAPYVGAFMEDVLPYLGYEPSYLTSEKTVAVENYTDMTLSEARKSLAQNGIDYLVIGNGDRVIRQTPDKGSKIYVQSGRVILYTEDTGAEDYVTMPLLIGKSADEANRILSTLGLNVLFRGATSNTFSSNATVTAQSSAAGTRIKIGSIVTITMLHTKDTD